MQRLFRTKEQKKKTGTAPYPNLIDPARFDAILKGVLTLIAPLLLHVPVLIMTAIQSAGPSHIKSQIQGQMLVIPIFTMVISTCCFLFTVAKKQAVFTAAVTYSAILTLVLLLANIAQDLTLWNSG